MRVEVRVVATRHTCLGVRSVTLVLDTTVAGFSVLWVTSFSVLGVAGARGLVANSGRIGVVALADLVGCGVRRQSVGIFMSRSGVLAFEHTHELAAATVTRGVVVSRTGTEAGLLAAVAD